MVQIANGTVMTVVRQVADELSTRADAADKAGVLPAEDVALLKESGYTGLSVPREFGGQGLSLRECVAAQLTLAQGSPSTAMVAAMTLQVMGHEREQRSWPAAMWARIATAVAQGALINSVASEPLMGSPSRGSVFATTITADGDRLVINGHKTWTTGGRHLDFLAVKAAYGAGESAGSAVVLVEKDTPGLRWVENWGEIALGLRASDSHDLIFEQVRVPVDNLMARRDGAKSPNVWFPMMLTAVYLGAAIAARDTVIAYALERVPTALGAPIATLPKIQRQIGEIDVQLQAAQALLFEVAGLWHGPESAAVYPRVAAAKQFCVEVATRVTGQALAVAGGAGLTRALPLERYFRDVQAGVAQPPAGDTAFEMVGKHAIGVYESTRDGAVDEE